MLRELLQMTKSQRGFTILEMLIVAALMLVVILGFVSMVNMQHSTIRSSQASLDSDSIQDNVTKLLVRVSDCTKNLGGVNPNVATSLSNLKNQIGVPLFTTGTSQLFGKQNVYLQKIEIAPGPRVLGPNDQGFIYVKLTTASTTSVTGPGLAPRSVPLWVKTDALSRVRECAGAASRHYNCKTYQAMTGSQDVYVYCPGPLQIAVSCSFTDADSDKDKHGWMTIIAPSAAHPSGGCAYHENRTAGGQGVYAVCCDI